MFILNKNIHPRHDVHIHVQPNSQGNTSVDMAYVMNGMIGVMHTLKTHAQIEKAFTDQFKHILSYYPIGREKTKQALKSYKMDFDFKTKNLNFSSNVVYNIQKIKQRGSPYYGIHIYVYFLNASNFKSIVQHPKNFHAEFKKVAVYRKEKNVMYRIENDGQPYHVESLVEAEFLKDNKGASFTRVNIVRAGGKIYEVASLVDVKKIDMKKNEGLYIFESKAEIPDALTCKEVTLSDGKKIFTNSNLKKLSEGVYPAKGTCDSALIVAVYKSFAGENKTFTYETDSDKIKLLQQKLVKNQTA